MGGQGGKGALVGSTIDPVGGGALGGYLGHQKGNRHATPAPYTPPPQYDLYPQGGYAPSPNQKYGTGAVAAAPQGNPWGPAQAPNWTGAGKGAPPAAQGPGVNTTAMSRQGAPPAKG